METNHRQVPREIETPDACHFARSGGKFSRIPMIPSLAFPLDSMPELIQCGLCTHGARAVETFCQRGLWSLHVYHYTGQIQFRSRAYAVHPGWASLLPPDENVTWEFPPHAPHYYAHFRVRKSKTDGIRAPLLQALGMQRDRFDLAIGEMVRFFPEPGTRAHVRLWDLLHRYAATAESGAPGEGLHPAVQIAVSIIRNSPSERIWVSDIARQMGVSHNHLTLLFQKHLGCGVREYIRRERIDRACIQLRKTQIPVKAIAAECGFPDLQYFNKIIRTVTGQSPTALRKQQG